MGGHRAGPDVDRRLVHAQAAGREADGAPVQGPDRRRRVVVPSYGGRLGRAGQQGRRRSPRDHGSRGCGGARRLEQLATCQLSHDASLLLGLPLRAAAGMIEPSPGLAGWLIPNLVETVWGSSLSAADSCSVPAASGGRGPGRSPDEEGLEGCDCRRSMQLELRSAGTLMAHE